MNKGKTIKIGVIGVGHLGNFHLKQLGKIPQVSITGLYDNDQNRAEEMCSPTILRMNYWIHVMLYQL